MFALCNTCRNETISSPEAAPPLLLSDDDDRFWNAFGTGDISNLSIVSVSRENRRAVALCSVARPRNERGRRCVKRGKRMFAV